MSRHLLGKLCLTASMALAACLVAAAEPPAKPPMDKAKPRPAVRADLQDFVFLTEARPVLVRLHVRIGGQTPQDACDDFLKHLFAYLDINGNGVLSKDEAERVPSVEQLLNGGFAAFLGSGSAKLADLDADKDGKVTLAEMSDYYRKKGYTPFQFQLNPNDNAASAQLAYLGGPRPDPEVSAVSKSIFTRLDADKDGKLTREELTAAPEVLLRLDENEDEIVTTQEMVPDAKPPSLLGASMSMMAGGRNPGAAGNKTLTPVAVPDEMPAELTKRLHERYDARTADKGKEKTLSRKALGLDEATFARLDADKDGKLDDAELARFVKRPPDLCLTVHLGDANKAKSPVELMPVEGKPSALADKAAMHEGLLRLDLGAARAEFRRGQESNTDTFTNFLRPQLIAQFKGADADGNGYIDDKEAKKNRFLGGLFKAADRNADGKLTEQEFIAYLDKSQDLQKRASAACVTLELRDRSRGLFDLLDTNGDNKLSVREMRQAPKLLAQLDHEPKGHLVAGDLPRSYLLTVRPGTANAGQGQEAVLSKLYSGGYKEEEVAGRGPAWFRKMDKNRDGDVSRREFLFSDEQFKKLDADGDGLISVEEAERASGR